MNESNNFAKRIAPLVDLSKDSHYLQEEAKLINSIYIDSNNDLFVPASQSIYILSLKKKSFQKNWIKQYIHMPLEVKLYKNKEKQEIFFRDKYTTIFNCENSKEKDDLEFINYATSSSFAFDSSVFRGRLLSLNSFDELSFKIKDISISPIGITRRNKHILSVLMNNSECFLLNYKDEDPVKQYKIDVCINQLLIKKKQIENCEEACSMCWSNEIKDDKGSLMSWFGIHFPSKIFIFDIKKNEKQASIDINSIYQINLEEFPFKSSHIVIFSCSFKKEIIHINIFSNQNNILFLEYQKNDLIEEQICSKKPSFFDVPSFDIIKVLELNIVEPSINCECQLILSSINKVFTLHVKEEALQNYFETQQPIIFVSLQQQKHNFVLSSINNKVYIINNSEKKDQTSYSYQSLMNLKGLILSNNKLLQIAIGNTSKQKLKTTNIIITPIFDNKFPANKILMNLINSLSQKICDGYILKAPLNLNDFLCIISQNHEIFIEMVSLLKGLLDENNNLDNQKLKKISINKQKIIKAKKKIDKMIQDKDLQNFILGRLFFSILMFHKEDFELFLTDAKNKFLKEFYKTVLIKISNSINGNLNNNSTPFTTLKAAKTNLESFIADKIEKNLMEFEYDDMIKREDFSEQNPKYLRCILTRKPIYFEKFFSCNFCSSYFIDVEKEFNIDHEIFNFYNNICPLCLHLVKKNI